jgi:hypothetical protein
MPHHSFVDRYHFCEGTFLSNCLYAENQAADSSETWVPVEQGHGMNFCLKLDNTGNGVSMFESMWHAL